MTLLTWKPTCMVCSMWFALLRSTKSWLYTTNVDFINEEIRNKPELELRTEFVELWREHDGKKDVTQFSLNFGLINVRFLYYFPISFFLYPKNLSFLYYSRVLLISKFYKEHKYSFIISCTASLFFSALSSINYHR